MAGHGCSRLKVFLAASLRSMRPWASRWITGGVGVGWTAVQADSRAKARVSGSLKRGISIRQSYDLLPAQQDFVPTQPHH